MGKPGLRPACVTSDNGMLMDATDLAGFHFQYGCQKLSADITLRIACQQLLFSHGIEGP